VKFVYFLNIFRGNRLRKCVLTVKVGEFVISDIILYNSLNVMMYWVY